VTLRTLDPLQFSQARALELSALQKSIKEQESNLTKRAFQKLPIYMRRRAASHNIKRIPKRLRAKAHQELLNSPPSRVKRRSTKRKLKANFANRESYSKWLPTHLWHAKRMKMIDLWGLKIPLHSNQKSARSNYHSSRESSVLIDSSYLRCIQINGNHDDIIKGLIAFVDPTRKISNGQFSFFKSYPNEFVAPVELMWNENSLLMWVHPSAFIIVTDMLSRQKLDISTVKDVARFKLIGPRSHAILQNCLKSDCKFWNDLKDLNDPACLPNFTMIGMDCVDPRLTKSKTPKRDKKKVEDISILKRQYTVESRLFDKDERDSIKVNMKKESEINEIKSRYVVPGTVPDWQSFPKIPVLLISGSKPSSWDVVLPSCYATVMLKSLIFAGCRIGGLRDLNSILYENQIPSFPSDYPGEISKEYWVNMTKEAVEKYDRTPKSKRKNYSHLDKKISPFVPTFEEFFPGAFILKGSFLAQLLVSCKGDLDGCYAKYLKGYNVKAISLAKAVIHVSLTLFSKGSLDSNAVIYSVDEEEIEKLSRKERKWHERLDLDVKDLVEEDGAFVPRPSSDRIVGIVTTGGYSLSEGRAVGVGYLSAVQFVKKSMNYCLVSLPHWKHSRLAKIRVLQFE
jgi:ribonuclease P/MRP protein subunit POP1